jgi:hypothetical protein
MKGSYLAFALLGMILSGQIGCRSETPRRFLKSNPHRIVSISVNPDDTSRCEVDFPVALLRKSKGHTIGWAADDHDYWIVFDPVKGSPLAPTGPIYVQQGQPPNSYAIATSKYDYYMYAIYAVNPDTNPTASPCKTAMDERDTGLNVKK